MSISVNGVSRTSPIENINVNTNAKTATTSTTAAVSAAAKTSEADSKAAAAAPIHFPWLSRLTAELEPVAKQKPAFPSTPALGDNLDQAA
jgi:hypothetical protein